MIKILFIAVVVIVLFLIVFLMMCAMVVAGRSDQENGRQNTQGTDIGCWKDGKCNFNEPVEKSSKGLIRGKIK